MPFLQEAFRARWFSWPAMLFAAPVPILVLVLAWRFTALERREEIAPFLCALGCSYFRTSACASACGLHRAAQHHDLGGGDGAAFTDVPADRHVVPLPLILVYTGHVYWLFRGKVTSAHGYH